MAEVNLKKMPVAATREQEIAAINELIDELEYILGNIDEKNMTPRLRKKLETIKETAGYGK